MDKVRGAMGLARYRQIGTSIAAMGADEAEWRCGSPLGGRALKR
jgi:hypothetical protein